MKHKNRILFALLGVIALAFSFKAVAETPPYPVIALICIDEDIAFEIFEQAQTQRPEIAQIAVNIGACQAFPNLPKLNTNIFEIEAVRITKTVNDWEGDAFALFKHPVFALDGRDGWWFIYNPDMVNLKGKEAGDRKNKTI